MTSRKPGRCGPRSSFPQSVYLVALQLTPKQNRVGYREGLDVRRWL